MPEPVASGSAEVGFKIRGTKGWNWTAEQYLQEIPTLVAGKMNFLMNCYLSMYSDPKGYKNEWWLPIPDAKKQAYAEVIQACRKAGIQFCFAMHPQLHSPRPLDPTSNEDFEKFYAHFAWAQSQGVQWFCVPLDDIGGVRIDPAEHARFVNKLLARLREKDPNSQLIFCPTHYWGDGTAAGDRPYLETLGRELHPDVYLFWTGPDVCSLRITRQQAETFKSIVKHRLILWDNYPVNDASPTLHLGPITGRDPELPQVADGYMSNPMCPQNQINRIPLLTCADYAYNPPGYDPARSIGQAIWHLAETENQRRVLKDLVEAYPGYLVYRQKRTDLNGVREQFKAISQQPDARVSARAYIQDLQDLLMRLPKEFPDRYQDAAATLRQDIEWLERAYEGKYGQ